MNLPRSSYYYHPKEKTLAQLKQEADLRDLIEAIILEFPRYGYRRVTRVLYRPGLRVNHKRVLRLMRQNDLLCRPRKKMGEDYSERSSISGASQLDSQSGNYFG